MLDSMMAYPSFLLDEIAKKESEIAEKNKTKEHLNEIRKNVYRPRTDLKKEEDKYIFDIELPGFEKKNIDVQMKGDKLIVSASHESEDKKNEDGMVLTERHSGKVYRTYHIPDPVKEVTASYKNGILHLEVIKEEEKGISITIK